MDKKELQVERMKAEAAIGEAVQNILREFHEKTGVPIQGVYIHLIRLRILEGVKVDEYEYIVNNVSCRTTF